MQVGLYITLEPERGNPVTLARIKDRPLLLEAARVALSEANELTREAGDEDAILGHLHLQEAHRLRNALETVLPELCVAGTAVM